MSDQPAEGSSPDSQPFERTVSETDLEGLKREQEEASRRYNDALTALDQSIEPAPPVPDPPGPVDREQVPALNERWSILPEGGPDLGTGWRRRIGEFVWRLVGPMLARQQAFNSTLVDHLNRHVEGAQDARRATADALDLLEAQATNVSTFQSLMVQYLQQITPFVDTKDREFSTIVRRLTEDNRFLMEIYKERVDGLVGGVSGLEDELQKHWEALTLRERRLSDFQTSLGAVQQAVHTLTREVERIGATAPANELRSDAGTPATAPPGTAFSSSVDSYKYVGFEDQFRGSQEAIAARLNEYVPLFEGSSDVLDIGCGRGEFLRLLGERGIGARGLDLNHEMVEVCRAKGFNATEGDALGYLQSLPDGSLDGLFAAQVIEHLQPNYLLQLIDVAYDKLRPGSKIVLETINPSCWFAFFESYIRDITHVRPIHPDTLRYLLLASGFQDIEVRYREPYPEVEKLLPVPPDAEHAETLNNNATKINSLLFTHLDYAGIGVRV